jgi:hypothetical protein
VTSRSALLVGVLMSAVLFLAALPAAEPAPVQIQVGKSAVEFRIGSDLVTRYHVSPELAKPFFWPVNSPSGLGLTRDWPMDKDEANTQKDHIHQKSLWFCHGDVIPEGLELKSKIKGVEGVDFWSENAGHGRIVCVRVDPPVVRMNHGRVTTHNEWRSAEGVKVLDETRTIHLYNLGTTRLLVFDIVLNASVCPITFGDTKEGSLGVRVKTSMTEDKGKGKLTNADGHVGEGKSGNKDRKGCWGVVSAWCDDSGPVGDKVGGVAIFADPANTSPTCWHARGYGLMAANPFGRAKSGFPAMQGKTDLVKLNKGQHLNLRYGVLLHDGDAAQAKVGDAYKEFVRLGRLAVEKP